MSVFHICNIRSDVLLLAQQVGTYLLANQDQGVKFRPEPELQKAVEFGQGLAIKEETEICGCSLIYKFETTQSKPAYSEIGTMRITANGYDLQTFLAKFHIVQIYLEDYQNSELIPIFAVVSPDTASEHNLKNKVGMDPWVPPVSLVAKRAGTGVPFDEAKYTLLTTRSALRSAFEDLKSWHISDNKFRTPKGDGEINIQMGWFEPSFLELCP